MSSLARGMQILELVAGNQEHGVTFPEIIQHTGVPNSSGFRILKELVELNYLDFDQASRRYYVSLKLAGIGSRVMKDYSLTKCARPYMEMLFKECGQTCNLGILGRDSGIYVEVLYATTYGIKLLSEVGNPFPVHCTAMGKVLMAYSDRETRDRMLKEPLYAYTEFTKTDRAVLEQEYEAIRHQGFAIEHQEITRGIECVSAPVFDYRGFVIAAVSVAIPFFAIPGQSKRELIRQQVITYAARISAALGKQ